MNHKKNDPLTGNFVRTRFFWTPETWNDGYIDNHGYFRIYRPDYPRAWADGYTKRYHVVWWLHTDQVVPKGYDIHHKNKNTLDDDFENLELKEHGEHSSDHNASRKIHIICICKSCKKEFGIKPYRLKEKSRGSYCSQECYQNSPRTNQHRENIANGLKIAYKEGRR